MVDYVDDHNDLVYSQEVELKSMREKKLTDLEDRSRHNDIKFRGILEFNPSADLMQYLKQLCKHLIPSFSPADVINDRIHRFPDFKSLVERGCHLHSLLPRQKAVDGCGEETAPASNSIFSCHSILWPPIYICTEN